MTLAAGTRLGAYEIVALLGAGGMGEVYRAKDTRLKREVAIKILPDAFASDPDRLARFQREAELLATLNHPNIGSVYGFEQSEGTSAIVLELIEGETLADRIHRGPIPVKAALAIALQIAEALEAAHERGVIHRDLKPANIKITPDDKVKVLDFGLAKALSPDHGNGSVRLQADLTHSPTLSMMGTQAGMILGTAAYMSPEQAKGFPADQRSDVFAFGTVLYEMLTGRQPFGGDTAPDVLASVIVREADLTMLPPQANLRLKELIERCLEKNPKKRYHAIADVRAELERSIGAGDSQPVVAGAPHPRPLWKRALPVFAAALLSAAAAGAAMWIWTRPITPIVTRFPVALPDSIVLMNTSRHAIAIAPNGSGFVYVADRRLYLRTMSDVDAKPITGTDLNTPLYNPVFSPDGQSIAFVTQGDHTLKKIAVTGGAAITVCSADDPFGMSWGSDGILFGQGPKGIFRVSSDGGTPEKLVTVAADELAHGPQMLPDGDHILFTLAKGTEAARWDSAQIVAQSISTRRRTTLISGGTDARYINTGHLLYVLRGVLFAAPFDANALKVTSGPVAVIEGIARPAGAQTGTAQLTLSDTGTLVYVPGAVGSNLGQRSLALVGRDGGIDPLPFPVAAYDYPRASPDGRQIAVVIDEGRDANIWIGDQTGAVAPRPLTFAGRNRFPVWSSDGSHVAYQSDREGDFGIFRQRADGSTPPERVTKAETGSEHRPDSWSPDGKLISYTDVKGNGARAMFVNVAERKVTVFAEVPSKFIGRAMFSPDGRWVAYTSDESGQFEALVQPYPPTGTRYQIGTGNLSRAVVWWSPDGKELLFSDGPTRWLAVAVTTRPSFSYGSPREIPRAGLPNPLGSTGPRNADPMPDGRRMLIVLSSGDKPRAVLGSEVRVVLNWFEELKQRVPSR